MHLSGWMRKEGIPFQSALKVIECIAADDEEKTARIRTLQETYKKEDIGQVSGYAGLLLVLINQTRNEEQAKQILEQVKSLFPKTKELKQYITAKLQPPYPIEFDKNEEEKENKNKVTNVQKHHDGDLVAEAIIIGRKPYFAVAAPKVGNPEQISITLQDSIQVDETTILKPLELTSYINKPYTFKSEQEFFVQARYIVYSTDDDTSDIVLITVFMFIISFNCQTNMDVCKGSGKLPGDYPGNLSVSSR
jgi:hypothetical protein